MRVIGWLILIVMLAASLAAARAQPSQPNERIEIGLSTEVIRITSDFSGQEITIFGAVDNIDRLIQRQGRYDVFLVLEGPRSDVVARRKGRVLGIWMNVEDQRLTAVPASYLVASTRLPRDITDLDTLKRLGLNTREIRMTSATPNASAETFVDAVLDIKHEDGLFAMFPSNVRFVSQSLFRASLALPANVPLGNHRVRAYLFRNGELVAQTQAPLQIRKAGVEIAIFDFANQQPLLYGLASVLLALIVGWLGRVIFRKD